MVVRLTFIFILVKLCCGQQQSQEAQRQSTPKDFQPGTPPLEVFRRTATSIGQILINLINYKMRWLNQLSIPTQGQSTPSSPLLTNLVSALLGTAPAVSSASTGTPTTTPKPRPATTGGSPTPEPPSSQQTALYPGSPGFTSTLPPPTNPPTTPPPYTSLPSTPAPGSELVLQQPPETTTTSPPTRPTTTATPTDDSNLDSY